MKNPSPYLYNNYKICVYNVFGMGEVGGGGGLRGQNINVSLCLCLYSCRVLFIQP